MFMKMDATAYLSAAGLEATMIYSWVDDPSCRSTTCPALHSRTLRLLLDGREHPVVTERQSASATSQ